MGVTETYARTAIIPQNGNFRIASPFIDRELAVLRIFSVSGNGTLYVAQDTMISPLSLSTPTTATDYDGLLIPITSGMWLNAELSCQSFVNVTYASTVAGSFATLSYVFERKSIGSSLPVHHLSFDAEPVPQLKENDFEKVEVSGRMSGKDTALPRRGNRGIDAESSLQKYLAERIKEKK